VAFGQLYYTSCQVGLSGSPGFQFQAASRDLDLDVMREVEAVTAYQPPRSLTSSATAEQIQAAPISLCYMPGSHTILARVVFVGNDYSHRFGNYFAHALVSCQPEQDFAGHMPIELWQAPFWSAGEAASQLLDELPAGLPPGPLNRATVAAFLRDHPGRRHLPALLTAAQRAVTEQQRKLVIVEGGPERVACWIAALCYLLPPVTVAALSFTTYDRQPRYSRPTVVGTVPDSALDRTGDAFDEYFLFDFTADRVSEVPVHPAAELIADVDVGDAAEMWSRADSLADQTERTFADWAPVIVAAQISWKSGAERARDMPDLLAAWLSQNAGRLNPRWVDELVTTALACLTDGNVQQSLTELAHAADAIGSDEMRGRIEERGIKELVWWARNAHQEGDPPRLLIHTEPGRRHATEALDEALSQVSAVAGLALLDWARLTDIPVSASVLHQIGVQQIGPVLLLQPDEPIGRLVLRHFPALRDGVHEYLDSVAYDETERLVAALGAGLGESMGIDLADEQSAGIRRAVVVARVRAGKLDPLTALAQVSPGSDLDQRFLELLWPPGCWSSREAIDVLDQLGEDDALGGPVPDWLSAAVLAGASPITPADASAHTRLCLELTRRTAVHDRLSPAARERVDQTSQLDAWISDLIDRPSGQQLTAALNRFLSLMGELDQATRGHAESELLSRFGRLQPSEQAKILDKMPQLFADYCNQLTAVLSGRPRDLDRAARSFVLMRQLRQQARASDLEVLLGRTVGKWNRHELDEIESILQSQDKRYAPDFQYWSRVVAAGRLRRATSGGLKIALSLAGLGRRRRRT
jgi:hypothetical protein